MSSEEAVASTDSLHAEVIHALVRGAPGSTTEEIQQLYEEISPLAYRGTTESPVKRRWRREIFAALQRERKVIAYETAKGHVWISLGSKQNE